MTSKIRKEDTLNILLASDIHLGYNENDPIRGDDSFTTFEEILELGIKKEVDIILLGGDLFHENRPSQNCIQKCISLLRRFCMGDRPVQVEFLSDPSESFQFCDYPVVNYEDPNLNIAVPVFSIHGNHDDPSGNRWISCLDLLSTTGLVNYFGKWSDLTNVDISPLLLRKGETRLALYGLSHIKDDRLARLFRDGKVKFYRPTEDTSSWFNLLTLHQNRVNRGVNKYISDTVLPDFLDLVLWGHEHECRIQPESSESGEFYITQPGSPVATSLCEAESIDKYVAILKICRKEFKIQPLKLQTVRPFIFDTIIVSKCNIDLTVPSPAEEVKKYVQNYIEDMVKKADRKLTGHQKQPILPLVRLRVEYSSEKEIFNEIRFSQQYQGKVANPSDVVLLRKEKTEANKAESSYTKLDRAAIDDLIKKEDPDILTDNCIEAVLEKYFSNENPGTSLQVLSVKGMGEAVQWFVDKKDKEALECVIKHQMDCTLNYLEKVNAKNENIKLEIENFRVSRLEKEDELLKEVRGLLNSDNRQTQKKIVESDDDSMISPVSDDEFADITAKMKPARGRGSRGTRRGRGRATNDGITSPPASSRGRGRGSRVSRAASNAKARYEPLAQTTINNSFRSQRTNSSRSSSAFGKGANFDSDSDS